MKKMAACLVVALSIVAGAVSFAQAEIVNLQGGKGAVDLLASDLRSEGVADNNINRQYGQPAMGTYEGKPWPGVRYQIGSDQSEDGWVPVSDSRVDKGVLCRLQKEQAKQIARVLRSGFARGKGVPQAFVAPSSAGSGAICSGRECWPYDGSKGITIDLRCPVVVNGQAVRTVVMPRKDLRGNNNIGAKVEYHDQNVWWPQTGWGPVIVFYNVDKDPNALMTPQKRGVIEEHLRKIIPMKAGQSGLDGDACYDLVLNENGSQLFKN
jgi:hypothetical protein